MFEKELRLGKWIECEKFLNSSSCLLEDIEWIIRKDLRLRNWDILRIYFCYNVCVTVVKASIQFLYCLSYNSFLNILRKDNGGPWLQMGKPIKKSLCF